VLPTSLAVALATVAMTLVPALVLLWGWKRGFFRDLDAQSRIIFEPRDWRLERPWESATERLTREVAFGAPESPAPGEWGGAERDAGVAAHREERVA
jgi:nitrogen fixation-related uncharacterized protein